MYNQPTLRGYGSYIRAQAHRRRTMDVLEGTVESERDGTSYLYIAHTHSGKKKIEVSYEKLASGRMPSCRLARIGVSEIGRYNSFNAFAYLQTSQILIPKDASSRVKKKFRKAPLQRLLKLRRKLPEKWDVEDQKKFSKMLDEKLKDLKFSED